MILFWIVAAFLIAIALRFVIPPLLEPRQAQTASKQESNLAILKDKLAELEADRTRGILSAEAFDLARAELEREVLRDADLVAGKAAKMVNSVSRWVPAALTVALPAAAVTLYLMLGGDPTALAGRSLAMSSAIVNVANAAEASHPQGTSNLSVEEAAKKLAERLQRDPDDADGWALLARSYQYLGREQDAAAAAARAAALGKPSSPDNAATPLTRSSPVEGVDSAAVTEIISTRRAVDDEINAATPAVDPMIQQLENRLAQQPQDADGWIMLGRTYQTMKRYSDAGAAYGKAVQLKSDDATLFADYADVLAAANGGWLAGAPMQWVEKAIAIDPGQSKALWLVATAAGQQADHRKALDYWKRLQQVVPVDSEDARTVAANIAETRAAIEPAKSTPPVIAPPDSPATAEAAPGVTIRGIVKVDPQLAASIAADDTVFIFARAAHGPRMPIAVLRKRGEDLPAEFVLDDSMRMTPTMRLSDFPEVVVGARISKSGDAMGQPGDLEGMSGVVRPADAQTVDIVIDRTKS